MGLCGQFWLALVCVNSVSLVVRFAVHLSVAVSASAVGRRLWHAAGSAASPADGGQWLLPLLVWMVAVLVVRGVVHFACPSLLVRCSFGNVYQLSNIGAACFGAGPLTSSMRQFCFVVVFWACRSVCTLEVQVVRTEAAWQAGA